MQITQTRDGLATLINVFTVAPADQLRLIELLTHATESNIRHVPGFVSAALHRSLDGTKVTMYAQWRSAEDYQRMRARPDASPFLAEAMTIATFDPGIYEVAAVFSFSPPEIHNDQAPSGQSVQLFRDKRGVFLAAFERYVMLRSERLAQELAGTRTGRGKVRAILAVYAEYSHGKTGRRGCLVVGSAVDLASSDPEMAKRVASVLASQERRLVEFILEGQKDGSVSSRVDAAITARLLLCVVQGMRVLGKTGRSRTEMASLVDSALKLLD